MRVKLIVGILLIISSIGGMYYWESYGRDKVTLTEIVVAADDIAEGEVVTAEKLTSLAVRPDSKTPQALSPSEMSAVIGKVSYVEIPKNMQVVPSFFKDQDKVITDGQHLYFIHSSWIYSISSLCEEWDRVMIYSVPEKEYMGKYILRLNSEGGAEIICELAEYYKLYDICFDGAQLMIVPEAVR